VKKILATTAASICIVMVSPAGALAASMVELHP
jgi:hypothetical protein